MFRRTHSRGLPAFLLYSFLLVVGMFAALGLLLRYRGQPASDSRYLGRVVAPSGQVLRFATGNDSATLDPQLGNAETDKQVYTALFEGLVEYGPNDNSGPTPAIAESWDLNSDSTEFIFHLRKNARWSNGELITAGDFVYTFRRGLSPELASINYGLGYFIKYARAYHEEEAFVRDPRTGEYLLEKDFYSSPANHPRANGGRVVGTREGRPAAPDTAFHLFINSPTRLTVPADKAARDKFLENYPKLKAALSGKEFVEVKAEDIGVEAVDDYTLRVTLNFPTPYFLDILADPLFRAVPRSAIEKYGPNWTQEDNIVTSGPFTVLSRGRGQITVVRNQMYWDTANVRLDEVVFYTSDDAGDLLNLYISGEVDAINGYMPLSMRNVVRKSDDYKEISRIATEFYYINVSQPPMNDKRVRQAFNLAIDRAQLSDILLSKPLYSITPEGAFPGYQVPNKVGFDPERAKQLLAEAGYKDDKGRYDPRKFPAAQVEVTYNSSGSNLRIAEFMQEQWRAHLGLIIPLHSLEWRTFLNDRAQLKLKGFSRGGWVGDYADPSTFLYSFRPGGEFSNSTGWQSPHFDRLLDEADQTPDIQRRYELLAQAEAYLLDEQPVIPLLNPLGSWLRKPYVQGMYANTRLIYPWKFIYIEPDPDRWEEANQ